MQTATSTNLTKKKKMITKGTPDYILMGLILLIVGFGIIMVYSASYYYATTKGWSSTKFVVKQLIMAGFGIAAMLIVTYKLNYHIVTTTGAVWLFYWISLILCILVKFIGIEANGAKRWLGIPGTSLQVQPSEFMKLGVILMVTWWLVTHRKTLYTIKTKMIAWFFVALPAGVVTVLGSNMSSGLVIAAVGGIIIIAASRKLWPYLALIAGVVVLALFLRGVAIKTPPDTPTGNAVIDTILPPYRMARIRAWADPFSDPTDEGYQAIQALYAVGSGGIFGVGLSNGVQKLGFLPEPYNDIIFAVICEELGLVGAVILMIAYVAIVLRGLSVAMRASDASGAFIAIGISSMIGVQAIINVAVNTNTIPTTGMQLPLVSYGGTALVVLLGTLGLLLNISRYSSIEKLH